MFQRVITISSRIIKQCTNITLLQYRSASQSVLNKSFNNKSISGSVLENINLQCRSASCTIINKSFDNKSMISDTSSSTIDKSSVVVNKPFPKSPALVLSPNNHIYTQIRTFQNVGHYHNVADVTLETIQDIVEDYFEEHYESSSSENEEDIPEVNYASGVLTMYIPSHGTWVINKQTPNEQIWWSSPISGPRRYEYDETKERWVYSRIVDESTSNDVSDVSYEEEDTLEGILSKEFEDLLGRGLDFEV